MVLLKAQPSLISKSISSITLSNWDPVPSIQYYCIISQLTFLCSSVEIDNQFKSGLKTVVTNITDDKSENKLSEKNTTKAESTVRGLLNFFVQGMIPTGNLFFIKYFLFLYLFSWAVIKCFFVMCFLVIFIFSSHFFFIHGPFRCIQHYWKHFNHITFIL